MMRVIKQGQDNKGGAGQDNTIQYRIGQNRTGQDRIGQDRRGGEAIRMSKHLQASD